MLADWHWSNFSEGLTASLPLALSALVILAFLRRFRLGAPAVWGVLLGAGFVAAPGLSTRLPAAPELGAPALALALALGLVGVTAAALLPGQQLQAGIAAVGLQIGLASTRAVTSLEDLGRGLVACVPLAAVAISAFDERHPGLGPPLFAISWIGMYLAVPDTELAFTAVGVVVPLAFLGRPLFRLRIGGLGAAVGATLFIWLIAAEGAGRPSSTIGAVACLGVLLAEPAARLVASELNRQTCHHDRLTGWLVGLHLALVAIASRGVSTVRSPTLALAIGSAILLTATALVVSWLPPAPVAADDGRE